MTCVGAAADTYRTYTSLLSCLKDRVKFSADSESCNFLFTSSEVGNGAPKVFFKAPFFIYISKTADPVTLEIFKLIFYYNSPYIFLL